MKAFLMHRDCDFAPDHELPANRDALTQDLELQTLFATMAAGDPFLLEVVKRALLVSLGDPDAIVYRQQVLTDCLENPAIARELYALAGEAIRSQKSVWGSYYKASPRSILGTAVQRMELFVGFLRRLRQMTDEHAGKFRSPGFGRFFAMLAEELDEEYFGLIESHLKALRFKSGMLLSAQLAAGNKGKRYMLRRSRDQGWLERVLDRSGYSFTIPERDESGFRALGELEDQADNLAANSLAQSVITS
jgi:hypothetical protein